MKCMATIKIEIESDYITLGQFLKLADLIDSGAQAKYFLSENEILVNSKPEQRRGRKLYKEDQIEIAGRNYQRC